MRLKDKVAVIIGAGDGRGDGHPRIERSHGRVGTEQEPRASAQQAAICEGAPSAVEPHGISNVPIIDRVLRLHRRRHPKARESRQILGQHELSVFDRAPSAGCLKRVERAYLGYKSDGTLCLRVCTTSPTGSKVEYTYKMVPAPAAGAPRENRIKIGKGMQSVYWQFELDNSADASKFELHDMTVLPIILSRKVRQ